MPASRHTRCPRPPRPVPEQRQWQPRQCHRPCRCTTSVVVCRLRLWRCRLPPSMAPPTCLATGRRLPLGRPIRWCEQLPQAALPSRALLPGLPPGHPERPPPPLSEVAAVGVAAGWISSRGACQSWMRWQGPAGRRLASPPLPPALLLLLLLAGAAAALGAQRGRGPTTATTPTCRTTRGRQPCARLACGRWAMDCTCWTGGWMPRGPPSPTRWASTPPSPLRSRSCVLRIPGFRALPPAPRTSCPPRGSSSSTSSSVPPTRTPSSWWRLLRPPWRHRRSLHRRMLPPLPHGAVCTLRARPAAVRQVANTQCWRPRRPSPFSPHRQKVRPTRRSRPLPPRGAVARRATAACSCRRLVRARSGPALHPPRPWVA